MLKYLECLVAFSMGTPSTGTIDFQGCNMHIAKEPWHAAPVKTFQTAK